MSEATQTQTVLITGAGGQLARAVVTYYAARGAQLVLVDRAQASLDALAEAMGDVLGERLMLTTDLGQPDDVDAMVKAAETRFGRIHAMVHTAGGFTMGTPVHNTDVSVFEQMMYVNARCVFVACGRVAKHMVAHGGGSIVVVLARSGLKGAKDMAAYTASKAAAERIVQSMAAELLAYDVRVNGVMPSTIDTPANRRDMPNADFSKWVTPAQLADVIGFLTSDAARAISGDSIGVYNKA